MDRRRRYRRMAFFAALLVAGCGGGGAPQPDPLPDLSGWWETSARDAGSADPFLVRGAFLAADDGTTFRYDGNALARTPTGVAGALPDAADPDRDEWTLELDAAGDLVGTLVTHENGDEDLRFDVRVVRRGAPVGEFVIYGTHADVHSHTSWARRWVPFFRTLEVFHSDPDAPITLVFGFLTPPPWAAVTYDAGAGEILAGVIVSGVQTSADTGHVTFTRLDDERAEGSYDFELDGGGTATGNFSVEILVDVVP